MPKAEIFTEEFYDKRMWKAYREGMAEGEARARARAEARGKARGKARGEAEASAAALRKDIAGIRRFFSRKRLNWTAYGKDIRKLQNHDQAVEFLLDLVTAADPAAFLRRKFGY